MKEEEVGPKRIADSLINFTLTYIILFFFCVCVLMIGSIKLEGIFIVIFSTVVLWLVIAQIFLMA
jgi:hypothetical protein